MNRLLATTITAFIITLAPLSQALAKDLALVITNKNYGDGILPATADISHSNLKDAYTAQGYEVISGENLDAISMRNAIESFVDRSGSADRVVVHFMGRTANFGSLNWLLPVDVKPDSLFNVEYNALSVNMILELLAGKPGRAVLLIGHSVNGKVASPLGVGIGTLDLPQGVLFVSGYERDLNAVVVSGLLGSAAPVADVLRGKESLLRIEGFVSRDISFSIGEIAGPAPTVSSDFADQMADQTLWAVAQNSGLRVDYQEYLNRFPTGIYSAAARAVIADMTVVVAGPSPEDVEESLSLTLASRRILQSNLTVLGFDTRGVDGIFGRGTRAAITAWQKTQSYDGTGYFTAVQITPLQSQADAQRLVIEAQDRRYWNSTGMSGRKEDLRLYLDKYPDGLFANDAKTAIALIEMFEREAADEAAWSAAMVSDTADAYRVYLSDFPEGIYARVAEQRLAMLDPNALTPAELAEAIAQENRLSLNIATRVLIEGRLRALGFNTGNADGVFDATARDAIWSYQESRGINPTGYIDPETVRALLQG